MGRILEAAEAAAVLADALTLATDEMAEEERSGEGTQIGQLQSQARGAAETARDGPTAHLARFVATWRPAARLLGLDVGQTRCAFGIAASEAGGVRANFGTMAKPLHAGEVNRAGVMAAHLAQVGFTANQSAVEARSGWGEAFTGGSLDRSLLEDGLGQRFAMEQGVHVKSFPSCGATHPVIRAMLSILSEYRLSRENIDGIEVEISQQKLAGPARASTHVGRGSARRGRGSAPKVQDQRVIGATGRARR